MSNINQFEINGYIISGYDYQEKSDYKLNIFVERITSKRTFMYAYIIYSFGEHTLYSDLLKLKIYTFQYKDKKCEYIKNPYNENKPLLIDDLKKMRVGVTREEYINVLNEVNETYMKKIPELIEIIKDKYKNCEEFRNKLDDMLKKFED